MSPRSSNVIKDLRKTIDEATKLAAEVETSPVIGIQLAMDCVDAFHKKLDIHYTQHLPELDQSEQLQSAAKDLLTTSQNMMQCFHATGDKDLRYLRAHLMTEELGEMLVSMSINDEVGVLDGLADLLYVVLGSAVTMQLPLAEGFMEVHLSNMSKEKQPKDVDKARVRDKGPNFKPPDLHYVLTKHRMEQMKPHVLNGHTHCLNCDMSHADILKQIKKYGKARCRGNGARP